MAKAVGQFTIIDLNDITISSTAPAVKIVNMIWLDTSVVPNQLKKWSGSAWINVGDRNADIEVGGRNYLKDSAKERTGASTGTNREYVSVDITDIAIAHLSEAFMLSFDMKSAVTGDITVYALGGYKFSNTSTFTCTTSYKRFSRSIVFPAALTPNDPNGNKCLLSFYGIYGSGRIPTVKNIKIEKGNKITDWTPAPEDTDQKFTNYYTKTETTAQINTAKDSINLSVDTKISTATTTINQTTNTKLLNYSTTNEMTAAINLKGAEIDLAVSQKIIGTYYQEATPAAPKNKEIWYKTEHSNYIVNNMSMTVNSLTGVTVNELAPVQKLYRYNGTIWQPIEDSDIANIKADIAGVNISVDGIVQKVEDSDGRIGLVELTSSQLLVDVANIKIRADTLEANINSLNLNIGTLTARIDTAQVDIGTLNTNIGTLNANINSIKLVTNSIEIAVNSSKLQFGSDGLTIKNGGFRILYGSTEMFSVSSNGMLYLRGEFRTGLITMRNDVLTFGYSSSWDGAPSGGKIYTSGQDLYIDNMVSGFGRGIYLRSYNHSFYIGNNIIIDGSTYTKKKFSTVGVNEYVWTATS